MRNDNPTVYSTEWGRICPKCGKPQEKCVCKKNQARPKTDGVVRIQRESKGRKGKTVTVVRGLPLDETELKSLLKELKKVCGTGGAVKNFNLEIQGDHRERLLSEIQKRGYKAKLAGG